MAVNTKDGASHVKAISVSDGLLLLPAGALPDTCPYSTWWVGAGEYYAVNTVVLLQTGIGAKPVPDRPNIDAA